MLPLRYLPVRNNSNMESLVTMGARYGTDKGTLHKYFQLYDTLLTRHRDGNINLLEIGTLGGESLRLWHEAFPHANITGMDINDPNVNDLERVKFFKGDAYTAKGVNRVKNDRFDVIIDDGPHTLESMIYVVKHYSQLLTSTGTLIIEDIPKDHWIETIAKAVPDVHKPYMMGINRRMVPGANRYDECLFVIDRSFNPLENPVLSLRTEA